MKQETNLISYPSNIRSFNVMRVNVLTTKCQTKTVSSSEVDWSIGVCSRKKLKNLFSTKARFILCYSENRYSKCKFTQFDQERAVEMFYHFTSSVAQHREPSLRTDLERRKTL